MSQLLQPFSYTGSKSNLPKCKPDYVSLLLKTFTNEKNIWTPGHAGQGYSQSRPRENLASFLISTHFTLCILIRNEYNTNNFNSPNCSSSVPRPTQHQSPGKVLLIPSKSQAFHPKVLPSIHPGDYLGGSIVSLSKIPLSHRTPFSVS